MNLLTAGVRHHRDCGQRAVEAEQPVAHQLVVDAQQHCHVGADHGAEQCRAGVDEGVHADRQQDQQAGQRIVLEHDLAEAAQHRIGEALAFDALQALQLTSRGANFANDRRPRHGLHVDFDLAVRRLRVDFAVHSVLCRSLHARPLR